MQSTIGIGKGFWCGQRSLGFVVHCLVIFYLVNFNQRVCEITAINDGLTIARTLGIWKVRSQLFQMYGVTTMQPDGYPVNGSRKRFSNLACDWIR